MSDSFRKSEHNSGCYGGKQCRCFKAYKKQHKTMRFDRVVKHKPIKEVELV